METGGPERKAQLVYLSHGGGPLPILGDPGHTAMVAFMRQLGPKLRAPDAILVVSAHWEEPVATVLGGAAPPLYYDYYGFPEESYHVTYPAPGDPELATRIVESLHAQGVPCGVDYERGFDHGLFIPLMLMFPQPVIPALQLSLVRSLDAPTHLALGRALADLMSENILVIGSGFSFHNMMAFDWRSTDTPDARNDSFQDWLIQVCTDSRTQEERERPLADGRPHPRPATATPARSISCRCTSAWAWHERRARWRSTTTSWASARSRSCGRERSPLRLRDSRGRSSARAVARD